MTADAVRHKTVTNSHKTAQFESERRPTPGGASAGLVEHLGQLTDLGLRILTTSGGIVRCNLQPLTCVDIHRIPSAQAAATCNACDILASLRNSIDCREDTRLGPRQRIAGHAGTPRICRLASGRRCDVSVLNALPKQSPMAAGSLAVTWAKARAAAPHGPRRAWWPTIDSWFAGRLTAMNTRLAGAAPQVVLRRCKYCEKRTSIESSSPRGRSTADSVEPTDLPYVGCPGWDGRGLLICGSMRTVYVTPDGHSD